MFSNIIVGVKRRDDGQDAGALASLLSAPGAHLTFVNIRVSELAVSLPDRDVTSTFEWIGDEPARPGEETRSAVASSVGEGLERVASDRNADLIVVGACERGAVGRVLVGDDAASVLHQTRRPVALVPRGFAICPRSIRTVGVAYDGSPESELARNMAGALADGLDARLVARCVLTPRVFATGLAAGAACMEDPSDLVARTRAALGERAAGTEIIVGSTETELVAFSEEVDLLVCGSRHNGPLQRLMLGSTSGYLATHARSPLLIAAASVVPQAHAADSATAASIPG